MATKSDVLGYVIKALEATDPASEKNRQAAYDAMRADFGAQGFPGLPTAEALEYLESAIARQEVFWLSQQPFEEEVGSTNVISDKKHGPDRSRSLIGRLKSVFSRQGKSLPGAAIRWPESPPGPAPGEATGPFADHLYFQFPVRFRNGDIFDCRVGYTYDPACGLTATIEDLGFDFHTRAWSMRYALEHLSQAFKALGLEAGIAGLNPNAKWETDARDCEAVTLFRHDRLHHAFEKLES